MKRWKSIWAAGLLALLFAVPALAEEVVAESQPVQAYNFSTFKTDLAAALNGRNEKIPDVMGKLNADSSEEDIMSACVSLAQAEKELLGNYENPFVDGTNASNPEKNQDYIRQSYLKGLELQINANQNNEEEFWTAWDQGAEKRAGAVMEMVAYLDDDGVFGGSLHPEVKSEMEEAVGTPCGNGSYEAYFIQMLIGTNPDGEIGGNTLCRLKEFEQERGLDWCGVINASLILRLSDQAITEEQFTNVVNTLAESNNLQVPDYFGSITWESESEPENASESATENVESTDGAAVTETTAATETTETTAATETPANVDNTANMESTPGTSQ